jgi:hypothetical protein
MQPGRQIAIFFLLFLLSVQLQAQRQWNFALKAGMTSSSFSFNKKSSDYNANWDKIAVDFPSKMGFAFSGDVEKHLFDRLSILGTVRYIYWGGQINSEKDGYTWDMDIIYQSIDFQANVRYYIYEKSRWSFWANAGYGFSNTFHLTYRGKTNYGTGPVISDKVDIPANFLSFGIGAEYAITAKFKGLISLEINNDQLLNNNRTQTNQGFNGLNRIPINYNLFALNFGIKL